MLRTFSLATLLFSLLSNTFGQSGNNDRILKRTPAEYAAAIESAIASDQADVAYINARAWLRSAPGEIPPLTAMASAYLAYDAPAAALESLEAALALGPDETETRRIHALKTQTLLQVGDLPAAWANARAYLRSAASDDPFASIIEKTHWNAFGGVASTLPLESIAERLDPATSESPLTAERIDLEYASLLQDRVSTFRKARKTNDPELYDPAGEELLRFLLLAHYRPDPKWPGEQLTPLYDSPEAKAALNDLKFGKQATLTRSLLDWAPLYESHEEELDRLARGDYLPEPPTESPNDYIFESLEEAKVSWAALQSKIQASFTQADAASSEPEILAALGELLVFKNTDIAFLKEQTHDNALLLQSWLEYFDASTDDSPLYQDLKTFEDSLASSPIAAQLNQRLSPALRETDPLSLPQRLANLYRAEATASWNAPFEKIQNADTLELADFDLLITRGIMTPELWSKRLVAAERSQDWSEIVWSGFEANAGNPQQLTDWLTPLIEENDALIANALEKLSSENREESAAALYDLKRGLERDPTHIAGLTALYHHFLDSGEEDFATQTLDRLWRLSPNQFPVEDQTLALAARSGNWPLLLSLCDHRILRSDTDTQALLHRQIAAIALGLNALALDSTPAFDGTIYTHQSRVLHSMALTLPNLQYQAVTDPLTGLKATIQQLGQGYDDPNTVLWIALGLKLNPSVFQFEKVSIDSLKSNASPALASHLSFIAGETDSDSYLASFRHTEDEALSLFIHHYLAAQEEKSTDSLATLLALSQRRELPLYFRAKAASLTSNPETPSLPLRVSDPYYVSWNIQNWDTVWNTLIPGQKLTPLGSVALPENTQSLPILRIAKPPRNAITYLSYKQVFYSRFWELDGVRISSHHQLTNAWQIEEGGTVALSNSYIEKRAFNGKGSLWIDSSDLFDTTGRGDALYFVDVIGKKSYFSIYRHIEVDQLVAEHCNFLFAQYGGNTFQGQGFASNSVFLTEQAAPFMLFPDSAFEIENSRIYATKQLDPSFNSIVFKNSYLSGTAQPQLATNSGLTFTELNLDRAAEYQASNYTELAAAIEEAKPGDRIDLAPGPFVIEKELKIPAGILIRGASDSENPSTLLVPYSSKLDPVITTPSGDVWMENITVKVEEFLKDGRFKMADSRRNRKALHAAANSRLFLNNVNFATWEQSYEDRPAIVSDNAAVFLTEEVPASLRVINRGRIDFVERPIATRPIHVLGYGDIYGNHTYDGTYIVSGAALNFHGNARSPKKVTFYDGAGDPRTKAWRELARSNYIDTLDQLRAQLPERLNAARNIDERLEIFKDASRRLSPIVRAAQESPNAAATALYLRLNQAMNSRPNEFAHYMEAFYNRGGRFPHELFANHILLLSESQRANLRSHYSALVSSQSRRGGGELSSSERSALMSFMQKYPVGHAYHARAMNAFGRGDSLYEFSSQLAEEEKQRRIRAEYEARIAEQRRQAAEYARQAAMYQPPPKPKPWWENTNYNAGYRSSSSSYQPYKPSPAQQMRDYNRQLNNRIFNRGRDYGKQYHF